MEDSLTHNILPTLKEESMNFNNTNGSLYGSFEQRADFVDQGLIKSINYALIESGKQANNPADTKNKKSQQSFSHSIRNLTTASLSISMLAKPSDDRKASALLAGWNVSNLIQGTGILGVPYAIQQGGWASIFMIFFVALLCCHTGKLLIECMYETSKKTGVRRRLRVNYPEVGEAVFGKNGFVMVSIIQFIEMFGGAIMYIILLGTVWSDIVKVENLGIKEWAAINCCVVLPFLFIKKMSLVSWLSLISVFSLMSSIVTLIVFCFTQTSLWSIENIPEFNLETFPVGFGIIVFSYTAHAIFPGVEGSMEKPEKFNSMMNYAFLLAAVVKGLLGTAMVMRFGNDTMEVATSNLKENYLFSKLSSCLVISNVLLAIPLGMWVVSSTFDGGFLKYFPHLNRDSKHHWVWLIITRPMLLASALFLAVIVPHFGLLMGIIGSFTGSCLCFIFPCYFHLKLRWNSLSRFDVIVDVFIIFFGVIAGLLGFGFSAKALVLTYV